MLALLAHGRPKKQSAIDEYCQDLRRELVEAQPAIYAGPNPWVAIDSSPGQVFDAQLAYVYSQGSRTRLVVLLMRGPHHDWFQTVNYFFDADGLLLKRERYLEHGPSNTALEESLYYEHGKMFSRTGKDHPLSSGHEDSSIFNDPDAPEFGSSDELPFPAAADSTSEIARRDRPRVWFLPSPAAR